MRKTTLRVPVGDPREPAVITFSFWDDPADLSPAAVTVGYARWRMPTEVPAYRPRGEDPRIDAAHDQRDERDELVMRGVLAEMLGWVRGCCDPAPADITWTCDGGRLVADCALTHDGHPVDLAIAEPDR